MIPGARLVMLGRQGAGKGTQCTRLSRHYVVPHISTGDMLRTAAKEGTPFGQKAREYMDAGELVPDDVMIGVVAERLQKNDVRTRGFILDGFPRTVPQAIALIDMTQKQPLDLAIDLSVPREVVLRRLASRRVCSDCQANYSLEKRPRRSGTCDYCGGDLIQRADDTEEAIARRLDLYERETAPLINFYRSRGELEVVDGQGTEDEVSRRLIEVIDARRERLRAPL